MSRFDECLLVILKSEGGYVDCPADNGGATNKGITQSVFDSWQSARHLPCQPVILISDADVAAIYRTRYWDVCRCDDLPPPLDLAVFDAAVQHGPTRAIRWLQYGIAVKADGICGNKTVAAVRAEVAANRLPVLLEGYMDTRVAFYQGILARDPSQKIFQRGWARRMNELQDAIA